MELVSFAVIIIVLALMSVILHAIIFVYSKKDKKCVGTIRVERLESGARTWAFSFNEGVDYDIIENMDTVRFKVDLKKEEDKIYES